MSTVRAATMNLHGFSAMHRERIIPDGPQAVTSGRDTGLAGEDNRSSPRTCEEIQLVESSILQNRRGTRYLMFDDSATIADVFALRCRTSPNAPASSLPC